MRYLKTSLLIGTLAGAVFAFSPAMATPLGAAIGKGMTAPAIDSLLIEVQGKVRRNVGGGGGGTTKQVGGGGGGGNRVGRGGGGGQRVGGGGGGGQRAGRGGGGQRFGGGGGGGNRGRNIGTGLAIGAGIGLLGVIAADQANRQRGAIEYCLDRYPNYDPQTQTWWDRRGRPHPCP
jgi:hypothetical protein